jgi:hypothetical protein
MKSLFIKIICLIFIWVFMNENVFGTQLRKTGIGIRGCHWDFLKKSQNMRVYDYWDGTELNIGGYGGALYFLNRLHDHIILELSISAIGDIKSHEIYWNREDVDATVITPVTLGFRYNILTPYIHNSIDPYISLGAGAYWLGDIKVRDQYGDYEEVTIDSDTRSGMYAGFGLNFNLTSVFLLNLDMRYHIVDFRENRFENGLEIGFGFTFMWGKYSKQADYDPS